MAYTILVIGKAGNGKSAICNTILGEEKCALGRSLSTATRTAQSEDVVIGNCYITVVDTPDITNCGLNFQEQVDEVMIWKRMTSGCPSAVLLAVRCDVRYTTEEYQVFQDILRIWGDNTLKKRLWVAFTFGDGQDEHVIEIVKNPPPELKKVLRVAKNKNHFVFNNKTTLCRNCHYLMKCNFFVCSLAVQTSEGTEVNADRNGQAHGIVSRIQDRDRTHHNTCHGCF